MTKARILANYVSSGDELTDLTPQSIKQTTSHNLSGTYSSHQMFIGKTFTITGDLTVNDNLILGSLSGAGTDITITNDTTERTLTSTGGTGILEGGELLATQDNTSRWIYEE